MVSYSGRFLFLFIPLLIGIAGFPLNTLGTNFDALPGDNGDARLINYLLEHGYKYLIGEHANFNDARFFYPAENTVWLSDSMAGSAILYSLFRFLSFDRETSLQLWWLSVFALNYFISFLCFKKISGNFYASVIVAWLFAFSIMNLLHLNYLQVNSKYMLPVIFTYFFEWIKNGKTRHFYVVLLSFFFQLSISIYYCIFALFFMIVIAIVYFIVSGSRNPLAGMFLQPLKFRREWLTLIGVALLSLLFLYPHLTMVGGTVDLREYKNVSFLIPKFQSFFSAATPSHWSEVIGTGSKYFPKTSCYQQFFPGLFYLLVSTLIPFLLFLKWKQITNRARALGISFLLLFFICIRWTDDFSPLKYLYDWHLFGAISFVSRIMIPLELLFLFIVLGVLHYLFQNSGEKLKIICLSCILVFIMWDSSLDGSAMTGNEKELVELRYKKIENEIKLKRKSNENILAIIDESGNMEVSFVLDAMMVSQKLGMKCINGYSSNSPSPGASDFWMWPTRAVLYKYCQDYKIDLSRVLIIEKPKER